MTPKDNWGNVYKLGSIQSSEDFDPNSLKGMEAVALEYSKDTPATSYALLKTKGGNEYHIYESAMGNDKGDKANATAKRKYDFSDEVSGILSKSVATLFSKSSKVLYAFTPDKVYAIAFGGTDSKLSSAKEVYSIPAGEKITKAKLFVQGEYTVASNYISSLRPSPAELGLNLKAIIIASQKGTEGILRIFPIDQDKIGTGALVTTPESVSEFKGFTRILDFVQVGQ